MLMFHLCLGNARHGYKEGEEMWREQYDRLRRWYDRFQEIECGRDHTRETLYYEDVVYAFFQNCHHFKDWLKNDTSIGLTRNEPEDVVNNSADLKICADLANGTKHLTLRSPRTGPVGANMGKQFVSLHVGSQPTKIAIKYEIDLGISTCDAFQTAVKCLQEWDNFLNTKGLL
jgi:hypothetical protein